MRLLYSGIIDENFLSQCLSFIAVYYICQDLIHLTRGTARQSSCCLMVRLILSSPLLSRPSAAVRCVHLACLDCGWVSGFRDFCPLRSAWQVSDSFVYVSGEDATKQQGLVCSKGITHIINCADSQCGNYLEYVSEDWTQFSSAERKYSNCNSSYFQLLYLWLLSLSQV
ncbi:unnamed protein product [Ascophyllum nodosum]